MGRKPGLGTRHHYPTRPPWQAPLFKGLTAALLVFAYFKLPARNKPTTPIQHPEQNWPATNEFIQLKDLKSLSTGCHDFPLSLTQDIDSQCSQLRPMKEAYTIQDFIFGYGVQSKVKVVNEVVSGEEYVAVFVRTDSYFNRTSILPHLLKTGQAVCDLDNIAQLADVVCYNETVVVPIFQKCKGQNLIEYFALGKSLDAKTNCTRLSPANIRKAIKGIFVGLNQLIDIGMCHRDLSLNNAMFDEETGELCIIDFGLAKETTKYGECIGLYMDIPLDKSGADIATALDTETRQKIEKASWDSVYHLPPLNFRNDDTQSIVSMVGSLLSVPTQLVYTTKPELASFHLVNDTAKFLGREKLMKHVEMYNLTMPAWLENKVENVSDKAVDWKTLKNKCNEELLTDDAVSFLEELITFSYVDRLNFIRNKAEKHPFLANL